MTSVTKVQLGRTDVPATFFPEVRSFALYTFEKAPLNEMLSEEIDKKAVKSDALSHLLNELEILETLVNRHLRLCLALLLDDLLSSLFVDWLHFYSVLRGRLRLSVGFLGRRWWWLGLMLLGLVMRLWRRRFADVALLLRSIMVVLSVPYEI